MTNLFWFLVPFLLIMRLWYGIGWSHGYDDALKKLERKKVKRR